MIVVFGLACFFLGLGVTFMVGGSGIFPLLGVVLALTGVLGIIAFIVAVRYPKR